MITCDSNVLIFAAQYHANSIYKNVAEARFAAQLMASRRRRALRIPSLCFGEVFIGSGTSAEMDILAGFFERVPIIEYTQKALLRGMRLRRLLKRGPKHTLDCVIYAQSALAEASRHISYDKDMSGATNRRRIPAFYRGYFGGPAPNIMNPQEDRIMTNPRPKRKTEIERLRDRLFRHAKQVKARAYRAALDDGCRTDADVTRYFAGAAKMYESY